jgi:hypothetical protein
MAKTAEVVQSSLFSPPPTKPAPPLAFGDYDQLGLEIEAEKPREILIENCVVQGAPKVETVEETGKKEWRCGFSAPSDLWHQDRDELVEARASSQERIDGVKGLRLKPGDMVTIAGLVTQQQLLTRGVKVTQLTYLNVTDIRVCLRAAKNPMFVKAARR